MKKRSSALSAAVQTLIRFSRIRRARRAGDKKKPKEKKEKHDPTLFVYCDQFLE